MIGNYKEIMDRHNGTISELELNERAMTFSFIFPPLASFLLKINIPVTDITSFVVGRFLGIFAVQSSPDNALLQKWSLLWLELSRPDSHGKVRDIYDCGDKL